MKDLMMRKFLLTIALAALSLGLTVLPNESEAKRFGGGASIGRQQAAPPSRVAPQQNAAQSSAAPAAGAAGAAAKPGFMQRFGPILAGLGLGVLFASLFGGNLAGMLGGLLTILLVVAGLVLAYRFFIARNQPSAMRQGMRQDMQYAGAPAGGFGGSAQGNLPPPRLWPQWRRRCCVVRADRELRGCGADGGRFTGNSSAGAYRRGGLHSLAGCE
jgi:hypothetical protein